MRKHTAILALMTILTTSSAALAEAPTSQFGFKGWPYRNTTACTEGAAGNADCSDQPSCSTNAPVCPTVDACLPTEGCENGQSSVCPATSSPAPSTSAPVMPTAVPESGATAVPTASPTRAPSMDDDYTTVGVSVQEQNAATLLNRDRAANGLGALTLDPALCAIARKKSEDMRDKGYFAHESPTYGSASQMLQQFSYSFSAVGENIAHHATVEKSQAAFMSSDGHRRNILGTSWTKVGVGVCFDSQGFVYVTQLFVR